jgi:hypothetical protein
MGETRSFASGHARCARASLLMGEHAGSLMAVTVAFEKRAT